MRERRVVVHRAGSYERLVIEDAAIASPRPGEVAIDVRAIGVNYADVIVRMGLYASAREYVGWPITPGFEVAGVVRQDAGVVAQVVEAPGRRAAGGLAELDGDVEGDLVVVRAGSFLREGDEVRPVLPDGKE